ncbi:hypothetical protein DPMN_138848 [Dreissena polymorpha]|uniref:Carboxylic ester hydrolase n=2 Tax=Dreissena polymorpha TaxID=45954 RepID=A0A9D4JF35_DREPO|nr:hypothetical protein DPMN_138848 [Dreissena polymorpha]
MEFMKMTRFVCCSVLLLLLAIPVIQSQDSAEQVSVETPLGIFNGLSDIITLNKSRKFYTAFKGVPYAKPPVNDLRFRRPLPMEFKNDHIHNATFHRLQCVQPPGALRNITLEQSEDCLYLNIYCPGRGVNASGIYPVMIYIHGGSFSVGGANIFSGDVLCAFNDVILVTLNYRLDVLGFLSSGQTGEGNYGLWDMHLAIKWVNQYIGYFGGDKTRVTLFGNSAGGAAVHYQAMFLGNRGLIHRVIAQSGVATAGWSVQNAPSKQFDEVVNNTGCNLGKDYSVIMECLRKVNSAYLTMQGWRFAPSIDNEFIFEHPKLMSHGLSQTISDQLDFFSEIDFMSGITSQDGFYDIMEPEYLDKIDLKDKIVAYVDPTHEKKVSEYRLDELVHQYTNVPKHTSTEWDTTEVARYAYLEFRTDIIFAIPTILACDKHSELAKRRMEKAGKTYFYFYDQQPSFARQVKWIPGVPHTYELPVLYGFTEDLNVKYTSPYFEEYPRYPTPEDIEMSKILMQLWTNFAKYGSPNNRNASNELTVPSWPQYQTDTGYYLELKLNLTDTSIKQHYKSERLALLSSLQHRVTNSGQFTVKPAVGVAWTMLMMLHMQ